jgi:hypothetical protein
MKCPSFGRIPKPQKRRYAPLENVQTTTTAIDKDELRQMFDRAVEKIINSRTGPDLKSGLYASIGDSIFERCSSALSDRVNNEKRLRVASAPSGSGKTTFAYGFAIAFLEYVQRHPETPGGIVFVVEQIVTADNVFKELNALAPGKVAVWTSEHDPKCKTREKLTTPAKMFRQNDLRRYPIAIVTHTFFNGGGGDKARLWSPNNSGDIWESDQQRALMIIDERPEDIAIFQTSLADAVRIRDEIAHKIPEIHDHVERLVQVMQAHDQDIEQQIIIPDEVEAAKSFGWFASEQAARIVTGYPSIAGIGHFFGFAKATTQGLAFIARHRKVPAFVGWFGKFQIRPGMVLLDATADIDGVHQVAPEGRDVIGGPEPNYEPLEIIHVPQFTRQNLRQFFRKPENRRAYTKSLIKTVLDTVKPGQKAFIVCKLDLIEQEHIPPLPNRFKDPDEWRKGFGWNLDGRHLSAGHWGTGIGANYWRDADVVLLFDLYHLPRPVAVGTVQGLRNHTAREGALPEMTTLRSKNNTGAKVIAEGHSMRWLKQLAMRGKARNYSADGKCGKQRLVISCDEKQFLSVVAMLFPGAKHVTMTKPIAISRSKTKQAAAVLRELSKARDRGLTKISGQEVGGLVGRSWRSISGKLMTPDMLRAALATGWRYVPGRGSVRAYFERVSVNEANAVNLSIDEMQEMGEIESEAAA